LQLHDIAYDAVEFNRQQPPVLPVLLLEIDAKKSALVRW
jgi:hypothetical protein